MAKVTQKIRVTNESSSFTTLWLEPWGEDYGMFPNDIFEILAIDVEETFYFHISRTDKDILVYAEGDPSSYPSVYQNSNLLSCGHNRQNDFQ
jgi:hypothetical protein